MECSVCPYAKGNYENNIDIKCKKVGGDPVYSGYCEDAIDNIPERNKNSNKKRKTKRERELKYKANLKDLSKNSSKYYTVAYLVEEIKIKEHQYVENPKPYYKRLYRGKRSSYIKKRSNKRIRRYKGDISNGWDCHRLYDFWWELD